MTDIREIPFGERRDGRLVTVDEVERGDACDCVCPDCLAPLVAAKGLIRAYYFRHKSDSQFPSGCTGYGETALHKLAKQIISESGYLILPDQEARYRQHTHTIKPGRSAFIKNVRTEIKMGPIVPDVVVETNGCDLIVEIFVTHKSEEAKLRYFYEADAQAIEIDLSVGRWMAPDRWPRYILNDAPRSWLHFPGLRAASDELKNNIDAREMEAISRRMAVTEQQAIRNAERELSDQFDKADIPVHRCHICQSDRAHFGFGFPLTHVDVWACFAHRDEVEAMFARSAPRASGGNE